MSCRRIQVWAIRPTDDNQASVYYCTIVLSVPFAGGARCRTDEERYTVGAASGDSTGESWGRGISGISRIFVKHGEKIRQRSWDGKWTKHCCGGFPLPARPAAAIY